MKVLLDGQAIGGSFRGEDPIETTLRQLQNHHCPPSRMVVGIRCDDRDIPGEEMAEQLRKPTASVEKLEVFTSTRHELVISAMGQAATALEETEDVCRQVGELLNEGKTTEGIQTLGTCLGVWQQIHEAVTKSVAMLELDIEAMTVRDESLLSILSRPREVLLQIKDALTAQDYVLLADILQYEFSDVTDQWHAAIAAIRQTAEDRREMSDDSDRSTA